jgi:hypothetical protein
MSGRPLNPERLTSGPASCFSVKFGATAPECRRVCGKRGAMRPGQRMSQTMITNRQSTRVINPTS